MSLAALLPYSEVVGTLAAILTTASFLPQVWKTLKTRHTADFSWAWLSAFGAGVACWAGYGLILGAPSIIVNNVLVFACVAVLVYVKLAGPKSGGSAGE